MAKKEVTTRTVVTRTTTVKFDNLDLINLLVAEARIMGLIGEVQVEFEVRQDEILGAQVIVVERQEQ